MRTRGQRASVSFSRCAGPAPPRSRARRVLRPFPMPRNRRFIPKAVGHSAIDSRAVAMRKVSLLMSTRVKFVPVEGAAALFTPAFCDYLTRLHDHLAARAHELRHRRLAVLERALRQHTLPTYPAASPASSGSWQVPSMPDELKKPGIEISGPCSITSMFINALNPGPEGERAVGDLDDDEDSGGHRLIDTVRSATRLWAERTVNRELSFVDRERNRSYSIADGELPFF